jgi:transposase-like protein
MPFRETSRMEERIRMLLEYESGNWTVSELCRRHGICRDTFYEWRKRRESGDPGWFEDIVLTRRCNAGKLRTGRLPRR